MSMTIVEAIDNLADAVSGGGGSSKCKAYIVQTVNLATQEEPFADFYILDPNAPDGHGREIELTPEPATILGEEGVALTAELDTDTNYILDVPSGFQFNSYRWSTYGTLEAFQEGMDSIVYYEFSSAPAPVIALTDCAAAYISIDYYQRIG